METEGETKQDESSGSGLTEAERNSGRLDDRTRASKREAERFDIHTPDRPDVRFKQGLDDLPVVPTEPRTRDDVIGPRTPATKRSGSTDLHVISHDLESSARAPASQDRLPSSPLRMAGEPKLAGED